MTQPRPSAAAAAIVVYARFIRAWPRPGGGHESPSRPGGGGFRADSESRAAQLESDLTRDS